MDTTNISRYLCVGKAEQHWYRDTKQHIKDVLPDEDVSKKYEHRSRTQQRSPSKREYDSIEQWMQKEAPLLGLQPREMGSMIWGGVRIEATGQHNTLRYDTVIRNH